MTLREQLIAALDGFLSGSRISESRLSTVVFGGGTRISAIRADGDVNTKTFEHAMNWLSTNWPDGCNWPEKVDRPNDAERSRPVEAGMNQ